MPVARKPRPRRRLKPTRTSLGAAAYWAQSWELRQLDRLRYHGLWIQCPAEGARP